MDRNHELLLHLDRLHTTELGALRIKKNLFLDTDQVIDWCKKKSSRTRLYFLPGLQYNRKKFYILEYGEGIHFG